MSQLQKRLIQVFLVFLFLSALGFAAIQFRIPHEQTVRASVFILGIVAAPILAILSYKSWNMSCRNQLNPFRNGLGLTSLVLILFVWFLIIAQLLTSITGTTPSLFQSPQIMMLDVGLSVLAVFLAIGFRKTPRIYSMFAGMLLWASLQALVRP